ncbi:hypothetical protein POM88_015270 [Heracleum sosnowskyi]|uniref:Uncharacterized protein n=1 Tax=Heracleum sosnowskyi TaxID=360622 RepID=A0AAD8MW54_9APIA|nr:hypothetical protein POM88_015270 [Heracleum sosnowskyi]
MAAPLAFVDACGTLVVLVHPLLTIMTVHIYLTITVHVLYSASISGRTNEMYTWRLDIVNSDGRFTLKNRLSGHQKPIIHVSWSPDGLQLLTCGVKETVRRWNVYSGECRSPDVIITSFSLSSDNKLLLVSPVNQEIHLWNIEGHPKLVGKYKGHKRTKYVLKACFGGFEQLFVACGSEDAQVYIWHMGSGKLVETLPCHSGAVNSVSWNPANPHMLASASDDGTIRIWGLNQVKMRPRGQDSNCVHYSNGGNPGEKAMVLPITITSVSLVDHLSHVNSLLPVLVDLITNDNQKM